MSEPFVQWKVLYRKLDDFYIPTWFRLSAKKPKSVLSGVFSNWLFYKVMVVGLFFGYLLLFEKSNRYAVVQQLCAFSGCVHWIVNAFCRQIRWDEIQIVLTWFEDILSRKYPAQYEEIMQKKFKRIVYIIEMLLRWELNFLSTSTINWKISILPQILPFHLFTDPDHVQH